MPPLSDHRRNVATLLGRLLVLEDRFRQIAAALESGNAVLTFNREAIVSEAHAGAEDVGKVEQEVRALQQQTADLRSALNDTRPRCGHYVTKGLDHGCLRERGHAGECRG